MYTLNIRVHLDTENASVAEDLANSLKLVYGPAIGHVVVSKTIGKTSVPFAAKWPDVAEMIGTDRANMVGNVVKDTDDKDGWRVEWCGVLTTPRFNSRGAADAYLNGLFLGRKPEYPQGADPR